MARAKTIETETTEADRLDGFPHPRETAAFIGHDAALGQLTAAIRSGRLHHAWLLSGPKGIGKATLAYRVARALLKYGAGGNVPERLQLHENDPVFRSITALTHPDLFVLRRPAMEDDPGRLKTVLPVEEVRKASAFFAKSAGEGGWRICIADSIDEMNANAANALLKILEEPPPRALFLLISHSPGRLLPTIRSRCQKLPMPELRDAEVMQLLAAQLPELSAEERASAARLAGGSIGRALVVAHEDGLKSYREMVALLEKLPQLDIAELHALGDRLARPNSDAAYVNFTELLGEWLARMIRSLAASRPISEAVPGESALMRRLFANASIDQWMLVWENINALLARAASLNLSRKQVIINIFSNLAQTAKGR